MLGAKMARSTESEIAFGVLGYLATLPTGDANLRAIKKNLPNYAVLSAEDRELSETRRCEAVWEQQVRNIVCHRNSEGNYINNGYLGYKPRKILITDAGRRHLYAGSP
jgi:hypothetical protein